ncbi:Eco57I restriction-modification methylase domain-containing protein [Gimesia chilikensis]|uniref:Eco57I restriction-modification methylase domain-containing protein n=1 Tax=Gimesia chilikensis TaxID=2605989 RepID=UPI00118B52F5|nr:DNA methyltransferase [Gimesia chilikensis]QDT84771.1 N-6 DNA Methylase [Gimesia chilikensis]
MSKSPEEYAHIEWLGYVQPVGLVVSVPALLEAQCYINQNVMGRHAQFLNCLPREDTGEIIPEIRDLSEFTQKVLEWEAEDLQEVPARGELTGAMASLEVVLPQYHETLRPTRAVPKFKPAEEENPWMMLISELPTGTELDDPGEADSSRHWHAAPQAKFERLLRETQVPIGLLSNGRQLRLVYAPRGETSGYATFNVDEMIQVAGRPMFAALYMLLCSERLFTLGENQRLPAILENSRKYQNTVSTKLAEQVLAALYELMRGFQAANDARKGELLHDILEEDPNHVYAGLLTVLLRLVFVLYAEDRDLLSSDPLYSNHYSVSGLFDRLREDAGRFPDSMNQRHGAWPQLLTLFRLIYEGGQHHDFKLPPRKGYLFDPDRYPFLEGRSLTNKNEQLTTIPRISDGVVFNVLQNLLILDGERLSYRTLDVEQIGSVYETVMGFNLEVATGKSIAIKPVKTHGAPATIDLEALLESPGKDRAKWLKDQADQKLGAADAKTLKAATSIDELLQALDKKIAKKVTPRVVPAEAIVLQPSDERRRSGSHYTPRSLTEPIVRTTLEPILKQLCDPDAELPEVYEPTRADKKRFTKGQLEERVRLSEKAIELVQTARAVGTPHPSQILELKVCDPAMGSGAFLVETCRQLGDELVKAWYAHDLLPTDIPPDEDELLYARRLVAQRCLYGVDKNVMAVDLAKLSLWLVTLAKDHPFTFLDHCLRAGDSLVGLTREQIIGFHWEPKLQKQFGEGLIQKRLDRATAERAKILNAREDAPYRDQEQRMALAEEALNVVRLTGDACVSAFFAGQKKKERETRCDKLFAQVSDWYESGHDINKRPPVAAAAAELRRGEHPLSPFHWEIEFPEVFARVNPGFDAFVGNPPFAGKNTIIAGNDEFYLDWLKEIHTESHGNSDLVAHFFRRAFEQLTNNGTFGLISTNTIAQGDTRSTGLSWICQNGGTIYCAKKRLRWPGFAAVVVSVIHVQKGNTKGPCFVDGKEFESVTAFLFHAGGNDNPKTLRVNTKKCYAGVYVLGMGFTFDDTDSTGVTSSLADMNRLIESDPNNAKRIFPFIGGSEVNTSPTHSNHRYVINFGEMNEDEARKWPDLIKIVEEKVKPARLKQKREIRKRYWWRFGEPSPSLFKSVERLERVLVQCRISPQFAFTFLSPNQVFDISLNVFCFDTYDIFALLQSRIHEVWARFLGSSMKDDLRYTPSDCFDTFAFPEKEEVSQRLYDLGNTYFEFRAKVLIDHNEGLTKTYNRFHDPLEKSAEILKLRELHDEMDHAVLRAYGWDDLAESATCEFLLDYEEEEDAEGARKSKKKKPWRLRWPDEFRDEVLARLLELNEQRHQEELLTGVGTAEKKKPKPKSTKSKNKKNPGQRDLF